jgi:catechol 2,3-dioxygenase-like lactoylglutathione lyase family enzyme
MHLSGAVLYVKDLPGMRDFYGDMLRARPINKEHTESYALFDLNGSRFLLHAIPAEYAHDVKISSPPHFRERNPVKVIFAAEDVASERSRLVSMGVTILLRPWQNLAESCDGVDPEGNVFQIAGSLR